MLVAARFVKHCDQKHLFPVRQSAFHWHHSIETTVLIMHNDIIRAIDNGQLTEMLLLDLSSAFDTVDHDIMLSIPYRHFSFDGVAITLRCSPLATVSPIFIASAAVFHRIISRACRIRGLH
jgi:hypothetical protein